LGSRYIALVGNICFVTFENHRQILNELLLT
jgi:hypothetical protein